jgi:hypothetical protein
MTSTFVVDGRQPQYHFEYKVMLAQIALASTELGTAQPQLVFFFLFKVLSSTLRDFLNNPPPPSFAHLNFSFQ